jgi:hypothetical protein
MDDLPPATPSDVINHNNLAAAIVNVSNAIAVIDNLLRSDLWDGYRDNLAEPKSSLTDALRQLEEVRDDHSDTRDFTGLIRKRLS